MPAWPPDATPTLDAPTARDLRTPAWITLAAVAIGLQLVLYRYSGYSWHFFAEAAALLIGQHPPGDVLAGGLHLYAHYPQLQFGPLTVLASVLLLPLSDGGWFLVTWFMTLSGLLVLFVLDRTVRLLRPDIDPNDWRTVGTMVFGGISFLISWELLAVHFGHLDDVLALMLLAVAMAAAADRAPILTGLSLGLAVDAKPWALACAAVLLVFPLRQMWKPALVAGAVICVAWLPFVLGDPHTLGAAASFTIPNSPASALRALGVGSATTPPWDRAAQIGIGCLLGAIAVLRRRFVAVVALGIGSRIVLDPSVFSYYTAGLALGVLLWDLVGYRRPAPRLSLLCLVGLTLAPVVVRNSHLLGELRLWTVVVAAVVMLVLPREARASQARLLDGDRTQPIG
ncbi:MAG TPA: hypothetical protein VG247_11320 [Pseudonocardiaceae bacterium]|nr:hypothetical protein [Pseudonocardiaceae bacterium]